MSDSAAYDLFSTGNVVDGFDQEDVVKSFSGLFNCAEEKALAYATTKKVIRKDIDKETGESYSQTLQSIGLDVQLIPRTPPAEEPMAANGGLSLEPVAEQTDDQDPAAMPTGSAPAGGPPAAVMGATAAGAVATSAAAGSQTAPANNADNPAAQKARAERLAHEQAYEDFHHKEPFLKAIIGPVAAAIAGAFLWAIVLKMGYEIGLVALAVAGAIGWVANKTGFIGMTAGVFCAVLMLGSVFGGKYMGYSWMFDELTSTGYGLGDETWLQMYQRESRELDAMDHTTSNLKTFMIANDYAWEDEPITPDDLTYFKENTIPEIHQYANMSPAEAEEISGEFVEFAEEFQPITTWQLIMLNLGRFDFFVLLAAMGLVFRMVTED